MGLGKVIATLQLSVARAGSVGAVVTHFHFVGSVKQHSSNVTSVIHEIHAGYLLAVTRGSKVVCLVLDKFINVTCWIKLYNRRLKGFHSSQFFMHSLLDSVFQCCRVKE